MRVSILSLVVCAASIMISLSSLPVRAEDGHASSQATAQEMSSVTQKAGATVKAHNYALAQQMNNEYGLCQNGGANGGTFTVSAKADGDMPKKQDSSILLSLLQAVARKPENQVQMPIQRTASDPQVPMDKVASFDHVDSNPRLISQAELDTGMTIVNMHYKLSELPPSPHRAAAIDSANHGNGTMPAHHNLASRDTFVGMEDLGREVIKEAQAHNMTIEQVLNLPELRDFKFPVETGPAVTPEAKIGAVLLAASLDTKVKNGGVQSVYTNAVTKTQLVYLADKDDRNFAHAVDEIAKRFLVVRGYQIKDVKSEAEVARDLMNNSALLKGQGK